MPNSTPHSSSRVRSNLAALFPLLSAILSLSTPPCVAQSDTNDENDPPSFDAFEKPPHLYFQKAPKDPVSKIQKELESGQWSVDRSGELPFLKAFLDKLHIPTSSQLLVFSTTSLQLSLISPRNPRAIYFNEETYVGFIPGGRIEVVSIDPELGGVFYIFDLPRQTNQPIKLDRSHRCMNCHAGEDSGFVPGLVLKSVIPGPSGGSLTAYRGGQYGHHIPLEERFGGWHVTRAPHSLQHHGNVTGELHAGKLSTFPNDPGARFSWDRYPTTTSDLVPHLLLEHQSGFINRVAEAAYRARTIAFIQQGKDRLTAAQEKELDEQAQALVNYVLFRNEAPLPKDGIEVSEDFRAAFVRNQRSVNGHALKTLDLKKHLLVNRCSYMIHTDQFSALPDSIRLRVYQGLENALREKGGSDSGQHLGREEKQRIRTILRATIPALSKAWPGEA